MSAAGAGAAAAAAAQRRRREEEEHMTGYAPTDLAEGWEFKILRSATGSFKNPERLREALEQESAPAGRSSKSSTTAASASNAPARPSPTTQAWASTHIEPNTA
jgi:hypothetical protein